ncbi:MAG: hypothetical protein CVU87_06700 [Firmicutes bacterium HGW-Firmicutes-12]|jgi:hypothetical protein|nr:MAG: hypothetical protein CVU87_06700 [Firmicutes bacterium HGW-Firmicutes-12]
MLQKARRLFKQEDGLGTVELVIILAVLVGIALIFRSYIFDFVDSIMANIFGNELESIKTNPIPSSK